MKTAIIIACLVLAAAAVKDVEWESFKGKYEKTYASAKEENYRKMVFRNNVRLIAQHNEKFANGEVSFTLGVNEFADMTNKEFVAERNNLKPRPATYKPTNVFKSKLGVSALPDTVDWRDEGYVTPVKDQGQCGGCWAFSTTGSLEGQHFASTGDLVSLSEQNLIDCAGLAYGNLGCNGGQMDAAFDYIKANNGIDTEASYPYEARDGTCRYSALTKGATLRSYSDVTKFSEDALQEASATVGPISVAIDASGAEFQLYNSGVYYRAACSSVNLDHGVLVVGYGTEGGEDYWLVKNSWGTSWGERGYIQMSRNRDNNCGIATQASYPIV